MDNSDRSFSRNPDYLGVNKFGKNIKKSPIHQPNFNNANSARQQPQPQVYNINKNDFRSIVQQLTGSPSQEPPARPPQNPSKPPNSGPKQTQFQGPGNFQAHPAPSGLIPNPSMPPLPSPRMNGPPPFPSTRMNGPPPFPSPKMNGPPPPLPSPRMNGPPPPLPSPRMNGPPPRMNGPPPPLPSPGINGPPPLPSPTSQYLLPSPTGFLNLLSPRSPYPLLSPGMQHPPPLTPSFFFSPMAQPGVLGQGPQFPPSPGYGFPLSPGFFPVSSPRWRDQ
ncbi:Protein HAIKU1 [Capsicum annuum]|uniref:Protein HAIKU1 n=1 Tax=Capsicum annuum TaxID=4072 RepID=A0A2G2ZAD9_CAPAN|nr:Protein HAIKU1 [Capsicum annuum]